MIHLLSLAGAIAASPVAAHAGGAVVFILDASGSMNLEWDRCSRQLAEHPGMTFVQTSKQGEYVAAGKSREFDTSRPDSSVSERFPMSFVFRGSRYERARTALDEFWKQYAEQGYSEELIVFSATPFERYRYKLDTSNIWDDVSCNKVDLIVGPAERLSIRELDERLRPLTATYATPLAAAIARGADELLKMRPDTTGDRQLVVITDGEETCDGHPVQAAAAARARVGLRLHVLGIDLCVKGQQMDIAREGGGQFLENVVPADFVARRAMAAQTLSSAPGAAAGAPPREARPTQNPTATASGAAPPAGRSAETVTAGAGGATETSFGVSHAGAGEHPAEDQNAAPLMLPPPKAGEAPLGGAPLGH